MNATIPGSGPRRYAVVGTGSRAQMFVDAMLTTHADVGTPVAWCDVNGVRMSYYDELYRAARGADAPLPPRYAPDDFDKLLAEVNPDGVVVTSPDWTHHRYVVAALENGCDVIVEKPLTTSVESARAIAASAAGSSAGLVMTFNYRYSPRNSTVKQLILDGAIGDVTSVHFEWVLDTSHGADYFRRWHRLKDRSGGLLVHKATHHFDLVNWWLGDVPATVFALGGLRFYGAENAKARGLGPRPVRSRDDAGRGSDPFALDLAADDKLRRLYLEAEGDDGYIRDQDVFGEGITIEDNLNVLVGYERGASLSYTLNAHSPWEGYRVAFNGTAGRIEIEVVESAHKAPDPGRTPSGSGARAPGSCCRSTGSRRSRCRCRKARTGLMATAEGTACSWTTCSAGPATTPWAARRAPRTASAASPSGWPATSRWPLGNRCGWRTWVCRCGPRTSGRALRAHHEGAGDGWFRAPGRERGRRAAAGRP